jgi:RND family efflux transporter MFP subunit
MSRWLPRLLLIPPLALGAAALVWLIMQREAPQRHPPEERAIAVRVVEVPELAVVPRAVGHGVIEPSRVWDGVAEIGARVVEEHPGLARGAFLPADALLLRLDTTDVDLRIAQAQAAKAVLEAQLAELERSQANTRASLAIEEQALALAEAELERQRELLARGTVPQASVEREERQTVAQRQAVQNLENQLALYPANRQVLTAQMQERAADLATARRDLDRAELRLPFDGRISQVNVRRDQYAAQGQVLVAADGMDRVEVNAQIAMDRLRHLVPRTMEATAITPEGVAERLESLGLEAVARLTAGDMTVEWPGRVARMSEIVDPNTRTVGVIVEIDRPYDRVVPGRVPPLVKSMFVEVELRGRATTPRVVIPRTALRAGIVHVVGPGERLEMRPVEIEFLQGDIAVIASGLEGGERVVVSDLIPAIEGMLLRPAHDAPLLDWLKGEAQGADQPS